MKSFAPLKPKSIQNGMDPMDPNALGTNYAELPLPLLVHIFGHAPSRQDDLSTISQVCR